MPFSKLPPATPPRGKRRNWEQELTLPTRLELTVCGLAERNIATYGFLVWNVGENRLAAEHGAVVSEGTGVNQLLADHGAMLAGLSWLTRQDLYRKRTLALTENPLVYEQLAGKKRVLKQTLGPMVQQSKSLLQRFPQLTLKYRPLPADSRVSKLAAKAYVAAQEAKRRQRTAEVIRELQAVGPQQYLVGDRYKVDLAAGTCTCPDFRRMHTQLYPIRCKHLLAAAQIAAKL